MSRLPPSLLQLVREPRHVGEPPGGHQLRGESANAACRDHLVLYLRVGAGRVEAAGFRAAGCPATLAAGAAAAELLSGLDVGPGLAPALRERFVREHGEPSPLHRHALSLVTEALERALAAAAPGPRS